MTPLRAVRHSLIRAVIAEYRKAKARYDMAEAEESFARAPRGTRQQGEPTSREWSCMAERDVVIAWSALTRAAALAQQARTVGEAMRVLRTIADNPIRPEPCLPPQCVWCERQQPRYNGAHTPDCALARLLR